MMSIYKYPLHVSDTIALLMPAGARLLTVQVQGGIPCLWAMVDGNARTVTRNLALRGTGHSAEGLSLAPYVGTVQLHGGAFVGHLFDMGEGDK